MSKIFLYDDQDPQRFLIPVGNSKPAKKKGYGCWGFFGDLIMVFLTGGLWLIWIFVREMRR